MGKIALGVGIGIGVPVLVALIALIWLKARQSGKIDQIASVADPMSRSASMAQQQHVRRPTLKEMQTRSVMYDFYRVGESGGLNLVLG